MLKKTLIYFRATSIKFLGVMIDENITWEDHIHTIEKKLAKNLGFTPFSAGNGWFGSKILHKSENHS